MAVRTALPYISRIKVPIECLISICFILLLLLIPFYPVFNVYAQKGGSAAGGSATSGSTLGGFANCYGPCYFYGPPAIGGSATGGNAIYSTNSLKSSQMNDKI